MRVSEINAYRHTLLYSVVSEFRFVRFAIYLCDQESSRVSTGLLAPLTPSERSQLSAARYRILNFSSFKYFILWFKRIYLPHLHLTFNCIYSAGNLKFNSINLKIKSVLQRKPRVKNKSIILLKMRFRNRIRSLDCAFN